MERNDFLTNTCTRSWDCTSLNERRGDGSWANMCESLYNKPCPKAGCGKSAHPV